MTEEAQTSEAPAKTPEAPAKQPTGFASSLNEENAAYLKMKNWGDDPNTVFDRYRDLERFKGAPADKLVQIPDGDDMEKWREVYQKLGAPEAANGYEITLPEGAPMDEARVEAFKEIAHKAGLNQRQVAMMAEWDAQFMSTKTQQLGEQSQAKLQEEEATLQKNWGAAYDRNMDRAKAAAREFGLDADTIDGMERAMGYAKVMQFMSEVGSKLGEHGTVTGNDRSTSFNAVSPAEAKVKIEELQMDKSFMDRYMRGDQAAVNRMSQLHQMVRGG